MKRYLHFYSRSNDSVDPNEPSTSSGVTHLGQWDREVLQALPPHIRMEVMQSSRHGDNIQAPDVEETSSLAVIEALPAFSQVSPH